MRWPERGQTPQGFDLENKTYQRLLLVQKVKEMGIHVSDDAVAQLPPRGCAMSIGATPYRSVISKKKLLPRKRPKDAGRF